MKRQLLSIIGNISNLKNFRRWPRVLLGLIYLIIVIGLVFLIRKEYLLTSTSSATNNDRGGVVFGVSLVTDGPQSFLSSVQRDREIANWSESFFIQSQNPVAQVYLDYISVYDNSNENKYCFTSFHLKKDADVPLQVISEVENFHTPDLGNLENLDVLSDVYIFTLKDDVPCFERGNKYVLPHLFLGIIKSETYANLGYDEITGYRAFEFFPFEEQKIVFDLTAYFKSDSGIGTIAPNLEIIISQQGWIGVIEDSGEKLTLNLKRPQFYKIILIAFSVIMCVLILLLNNIIDAKNGFFEVAFGLLLGLWGTHEILIPAYIESSVPIDAVIYVLYTLMLSEIVVVFIDELINYFTKRRIKILEITRGDLNHECLVIENPTYIPVDMTGWILIDQAMNKYKFPVYTLQGKNLFGRNKKRTVTIWTKEGANDKTNLYWGRRKEVWNNEAETAYLEDSQGEAISNYSYGNKN